jgi:tetratricopeptide (TPR) repeat protein
VCRDLARALEALGRAEEAAALAARAAALEGAHRAEAAELLRETLRAQRARELPLDEVGAGFERALELDPLSARAAFLRATNRFSESEPQEGLRGCAAVLLRTPLALSGTQGWVATLSQSLRSVQSGLVELLDAPGWTSARADRLARALLLCGLVELEGRRERLAEATAALDELLADDPALVAAWTLRGFLALRARDRARASQDLGVAREAYPGCPTRAFYEALLLAAEGAPRERVAEALALARQRGDARVESAAPDYPELAPHRGLLDDVRRRAPPPEPEAW